MRNYMQARASAADAARELAQIDVDLRAAIRGKNVASVSQLFDEYKAAGGEMLLADIWTEETTPQSRRKVRRS